MSNNNDDFDLLSNLEDLEQPKFILPTKKKEDKKKKGPKVVTRHGFEVIVDEDDNIIDETGEKLTEREELDLSALCQVLEERDIDDFSTGIIKAEKYGGYSKTSEDPFKKEFSNEIKLLYDQLDNVKSFKKTLMKKFEEGNSRYKGNNKTSNELAQLILNCNSAEASIVKSISDIKKNVQTLKMSAEKANPQNQGETDVAMNVAAFMRNVMGGKGRNNYIDSLNMSPSLPDVSAFNPDELDGALPEPQSNNRDLYVKYEKRNPKIVIEQQVDTGDWRFVAVADDGEELSEYPVPSKEECGRIKWSDDGTRASSEFGINYDVISRTDNLNVFGQGDSVNSVNTSDSSYEYEEFDIEEEF